MEQSATDESAIGGGFDHTSKLFPIKFKGAIASPDQENWIKLVEKEYQQMVQDGVLMAVDASNVKAKGKRPTSSWTMKKISDRT